MCFSDFLWSDDTPNYPTHECVKFLILYCTALLFCCKRLLRYFICNCTLYILLLHYIIFALISLTYKLTKYLIYYFRVVHKYLENYANEFDLFDCIKFQRKVIEIKRFNDKFTVSSKDTLSSNIHL